MKNTENATVHNDVTKSIVASSTGWDMAGDYGDIQFYNATLATDTNKFKKGDVVETISFMFTTGICQLLKTSGPEKDGCSPCEVVEEFPISIAPALGVSERTNKNVDEKSILYSMDMESSFDTLLNEMTMPWSIMHKLVDAQKELQKWWDTKAKELNIDPTKIKEARKY
jgi:hypothetical protein